MKRLLGMVMAQVKKVCPFDHWEVTLFENEYRTAV
jgi:hypothetical protein